MHAQFSRGPTVVSKNGGGGGGGTDSHIHKGILQLYACTGDALGATEGVSITQAYSLQLGQLISANCLLHSHH